ncbi:MAG: hypothetical protein V1802_02150 [Candidatus Aenigmatarchaeota archaeon]
MTTEKRMQEMEESIKILAKHLKEEISRIDAAKHTIHGHTNTETRIQKIENDIESLKSSLQLRTNKPTIQQLQMPEQYHAIEKDLTEYRASSEKMIEEESVARISLEKTIAELEEKIEFLSKKLSGVEKMESNEKLATNEMKKIYGNIDKSIERHASKFLVQELDKFAKHMDAKYPKLATKDETYRTIEELNKKMRLIKAPDISSLEMKITAMEKKLSELSFALKSSYEKMPMVVE